DVDECASFPCQNGGQCQDGTDPRCETDIDECSSSPCQFGHCVDYPGSYGCTCFDGFTGDTCEQDINECQSQPCQHGAQCQDLPNGFQCLCQPGTTGNEGLGISLPCLSDPCLSDGVCNNTEGSFLCLCPPGTVPPLCSPLDRECNQTGCVHGRCETQDSRSDPVTSPVCRDFFLPLKSHFPKTAFLLNNTLIFCFLFFVTTYLSVSFSVDTVSTWDPPYKYIRAYSLSTDLHRCCNYGELQKTNELQFDSKVDGQHCDHERGRCDNTQ
uniref:EGF-like domain-containing protein n=1 Tax=Leptobrachium leishanense TaxID=445787 RepID=A0A8C5WCP6_9ANUR